LHVAHGDQTIDGPTKQAARRDRSSLKGKGIKADGNGKNIKELDIEKFSGSFEKEMQWRLWIVVVGMVVVVLVLFGGMTATTHSVITALRGCFTLDFALQDQVQAGFHVGDFGARGQFHKLTVPQNFVKLQMRQSAPTVKEAIHGLFFLG